MPQDISLLGDAPLSLPMLLVSLGVGSLLAWLIRWHFARFGSTLTNREELGQVFPFVLLTTVLIISVVKSSLALSLGLVGALSIVRFRTPIKEPEELAYLFLSIALGLGLGAGHLSTTVIAGAAILGLTALFKWARRKSTSRSLYLAVDWSGEGPRDSWLERLNGIVSRFAPDCDLRRFDARDDGLEATYLIDLTRPDDVSGLVDELRQAFPGVGVTVLDQSRLPSP